jgi:hypothetical protein
MIPTVSIEEAMGEIDGPWSPIEVARVNDQVLRMARAAYRCSRYMA